MKTNYVQVNKLSVNQVINEAAVKCCKQTKNCRFIMSISLL